VFPAIGRQQRNDAQHPGREEEERFEPFGEAGQGSQAGERKQERSGDAMDKAEGRDEDTPAVGA
jgi:hypothetical protein